MPYCSVDDLDTFIPNPTEFLIGEEDWADASDRVIAFADAIIDGIIGNRYQVPFATAPVLIREISVTLAAWRLRNPRWQGEVDEENLPNDAQTRWAFRTLLELQKGNTILTGQALNSGKAGSTNSVALGGAVDKERIFTMGEQADDSDGTMDGW